MKSTDAGRNIMSRRVAPGIWIDADGNTHISAEELLELFNIPDTAENRRRVMAVVKETILQQNPQTHIVEREHAPIPPTSN